MSEFDSFYTRTRPRTRTRTRTRTRARTQVADLKDAGFPIRTLRQVGVTVADLLEVRPTSDLPATPELLYV